MKQGETPACYVDVDGTLLFWPGRKVGSVPRQGEPGYGESPAVNWPLVAKLRRWHTGNRVLVLWSRGGAAHCQYAAKLCGLAPNACLPKPRMVIDDNARSVTAGAPKGFIVIAPDAELLEL